MKSIDACKWFTPYITEAICEGYTTVMSNDSGGTDGCQIWRRGRNYITMWVTESHSMDIDGVNNVRTLTLSVARFTIPRGTSFANSRLSWADKWAEHIVASKKLYNVDALCRDAWWTEDLEEVRRARETQAARRANRRINHRSKALPITDGLLAVVRRVKGFKTVDSRYITVTKKPYESTWWITNTKSGNYVCKSCDRYREW